MEEQAMWENIIIALAGVISGGGLLSIFTLKQTKRGKEIENEVHLVAEYKELLEQYKTEREAMLQEREEERKRYADLVAKYTEVSVKLDLMEKMYNQAVLLRCDKIQCQQRIPPVDRDKLEAAINNENK